MIGFSYPFVVAATAHIYLPVYYKLQAKSVHYYLELRFNRAVRIFAAGKPMALPNMTQNDTK
jgi:hypothetical protein